MGLNNFLKAVSSHSTVTDDQVLTSPETTAPMVIDTGEFVMPYERLDLKLVHPERISDPRVPHIGLELIAIVQAWNEVTEQSVKSAYITTTSPAALNQPTLPLAA